MPEQNELSLREQLIAAADKFCAEQGISKARLSTIVCDRGQFFKKLEEGRDCTTGMYERFQKVFSDPEAWEAARACDRIRRGVKELL